MPRHKKMKVSHSQYFGLWYTLFRYDELRLPSKSHSDDNKKNKEDENSCSIVNSYYS